MIGIDLPEEEDEEVLSFSIMLLRRLISSLASSKSTFLLEPLPLVGVLLVFVELGDAGALELLPLLVVDAAAAAAAAGMVLVKLVDL